MMILYFIKISPIPRPDFNYMYIAFAVTRKVKHRHIQRLQQTPGGNE